MNALPVQPAGRAFCCPPEGSGLLAGGELGKVSHQPQQDLQVERLVAVVGSPARHRLPPDLFGAVRGHDDDVGARGTLLEQGQKIQTSPPLAARKTDVQEGQVEDAGPDGLFGLIPAQAGGHVGPGSPQNVREAQENGGFVIYEQDAS